MIDELSLCGSFWQPLSQSLMTQPEIIKHHVILTETARYLCLWGHEGAYIVVSANKSYKSIFFRQTEAIDLPFIRHSIPSAATTF